MVASIIGAWLLLPPASIPLSGLPDYDKMMAATVGILLGTLIFQPNRLLEFRPQWFDLPMLCWCIAPFISSLQNGYGLYDGLSGLLLCIIRWGFLISLAGSTLGEPEGLRELTIGIIFGGLAYVPAILLELRLSPFLKEHGLWNAPVGRNPVWRISPFCFPHDGPGTGDVDDRRFLDLGMDLAMWRAQADRVLPFGTVYSALDSRGHAPVPIQRCPHLVVCRPVLSLVLHSI